MGNGQGSSDPLHPGRTWAKPMGPCYLRITVYHSKLVTHHQSLVTTHRPINPDPDLVEPRFRDGFFSLPTGYPDPTGFANRPIFVLELGSCTKDYGSFGPPFYNLIFSIIIQVFCIII